MASWKLKTPISEEDIRKVKVGDYVYFTGGVWSVGLLQLGGQSKFIAEMYKNGREKELPFDLKGSAVISGHGHVEQKDGKFHVAYFGFSTASRLNQEVSHLVQYAGIRAWMGKGGVGPPYMPGGKDQTNEFLDLFAKYGCIACTGVGGCAITYAPFVKDEKHFWTEKGAHAKVTEVVVENIGPLFVIMDSHHGSRSSEIRQNINTQLPLIYKELGIS
ncbi:fumarate hydratase C-terminal domain-containing protein [Chloroflexota bacterium]